MSEEIKLLIQAIESLKQEGNTLKDYIIPFLSVLMGFFVAYFTIKSQEKIQITKDNVNAANRWTLTINEALQQLIAIKSNYQEKLTDDPYQRFTSVPSILTKAQPILEDLSLLTFIAPTKEEEEDNALQKWSQLSRIGTMRSNYNHLLGLWKKRNEEERPLRLQLIDKDSPDPRQEITIPKIIARIGQQNALAIIDLTETLIHLTDDIIIEMNDFLLNFPDIAKSNLSNNDLKNYRILKMFYGNNPLREKQIKKSIPVDYYKLGVIFGLPEEDMRKKYDFGY